MAILPEKGIHSDAKTRGLQMVPLMGGPGQTQVIIPLSSWAPSTLAPSPAVKKEASRRPELTWFSPDVGWARAVGVLPAGRTDSVSTGSCVDG